MREGLPDADATVGYFVGYLGEHYKGNARAAAFDVETGAIDPKKLQKIFIQAEPKTF